VRLWNPAGTGHAADVLRRNAEPGGHGSRVEQDRSRRPGRGESGRHDMNSENLGMGKRGARLTIEV
jgi:hypothetical protein